MSATGIDTFDRAVHKANSWVGNVLAETGWKNRHRALEAFAAVLQVIRDRLPLRHAVGLGAQLPVLIRGLYYQNWDVSRGPEKYRKREEFFERVGRSLSRLRILVEPDRMADAAIRVLSKRLDGGELETIRRVLPEELRSLWPSPMTLQPSNGWDRRERTAAGLTEGKGIPMKQKIKTVMTRDVEVARPDMTLREVADRMRARGIGSLPVCEGRRLLGIVTDRDLAVRAIADGRDPNGTTVDQVMTRTVVTCREDAPLEEAEELMHDRQIRRIPIVNAENELVGYLAMAKVARTEDVVQAGKVLKGISQPSKPAPMESYRRKRKTG